MEQLPRKTPKEAKRWAAEFAQDYTISGRWGIDSEDGGDNESEIVTYNHILEHCVQEIRSSVIICFVDDEPIYEINRLLTEVEDTHPGLASEIRGIDAVREGVAETLDVMIRSNIWNVPILRADTVSTFDNTGMRLSQLRLIEYMTRSFIEVMGSVETTYYAIYLATDEDPDSFDANPNEMLNEIARMKREQQEISDWISSSIT